ncbi:TetR/AcrR family transcriptional regulator [Pokkaliibacter sp. CJK22405]|uniref:TetR/AcrR family transcriptional regulator n=1 Tax=Pokkaliibacter sp. CJK22405 TaxID=3384615 RepID=UPI0039854370
MERPFCIGQEDIMARTGRPRQFDRDQAVDKAMNLFWAKGFESTSLADLRQSLGGLSAASFYAAFGSKQALYEECLQRYTETCGEVTSVLETAQLNAKASLRLMLERLIDVQTSSTSPSGCMAVLSGLNCLEENREVENRTQALREKTREDIRRHLMLAAGKGEFPTTLDPDSFTLMLDCFIKGIAIQARDGISAEALRQAAEQMLTLWVE